jgi:iron complex transport system substrate-binding protein
MNRAQPPSRRRFAKFVAGLALAPLWASPARAASVARRVIALDWGVAETLVALGHPPLAAAEIPNYDREVVTPPMPAGVIDVGLRLSPNPELMQTLDPDLIVINAAQEYMRPSLEDFAPVETVAIYTEAGEPYRLSCEAATALAARLGDPLAATRLLGEATAVMATARAKLQGYDGRPLYVIGFADGRHVGVVGRTGLFQGVFDQLGLRNAWTGDGGSWGVGYIGIEDLLSDGEARIVYTMPLPEDAKRTLKESALWLRLPAVKAHRVVTLPPIWTYGALPSALRFARLLTDALTTTDAPRG